MQARQQELENEQVLNEELATTNEELAAINEELLQTQQRLAERTDKLAASEETLRIAAESASIGTWSMSPAGEWLTTPEVKKIFGLPQNAELTYAQALELVHPDYKQYAMQAVDASLKKGEKFNIEYPIIEQLEGKERWIRSVGKLITDQSTNNGYLYGALIDITKLRTERVTTQQLNEELAATNEDLQQTQNSLQLSIDELSKSETKYRSLIEQSPIAQQVFRGEDMTLELVNETMLQFLGKGAEIIGKPLFEASAPV